MKSISFMIMLFLFGISVIACKETKPAETEGTATEAEMGVLTSDSLRNLRDAITGSLTQIGGMLDQQIAYTETNLASAADDAKAQLTLTLEQLKKQKANVEASGGKVRSATDETWTSMYQELETVFTEAKAVLRSGDANPSALQKPSTSPEPQASELKK